MLSQQLTEPACCYLGVRRKKDAITILLADFFKQRAELLVMGTDALSTHLSNASLPMGSIPSRATLIAAHFCDTYGEGHWRHKLKPPMRSAGII